MNQFYLITYAVSYVLNNSDNLNEKVAFCRFFDNESFVNCNSFLAQLKSVKRLRITHVETEVEEVDFEDYYEDISNTLH